jgi:hypothetical protein
MHVLRSMNGLKVDADYIPELGGLLYITTHCLLRPFSEFPLMVAIDKFDCIVGFRKKLLTIDYITSYINKDIFMSRIYIYQSIYLMKCSFLYLALNVCLYFLEQDRFRKNETNFRT